MTDPELPAHPTHPPMIGPNGDLVYGFYGLTIREHFAAMAMQSLFGAALQSNGGQGIRFADVANDAVKMADALIERLNK